MRVKKVHLTDERVSKKIDWKSFLEARASKTKLVPGPLIQFRCADRCSDNRSKKFKLRINDVTTNNEKRGV